jgi:hypothetical protein
MVGQHHSGVTITKPLQRRGISKSVAMAQVSSTLMIVIARSTASIDDSFVLGRKTNQGNSINEQRHLDGNHCFVMQTEKMFELSSAKQNQKKLPVAISTNIEKLALPFQGDIVRCRRFGSFHTCLTRMPNFWQDKI